jgi:PAS domain S-box-containing protein
VARELTERLREFGYDVLGIAPSCDEAVGMTRSATPDLALIAARGRDAVSGSAAAELQKRLGVRVVRLSGGNVDLRSTLNEALEHARLAEECRALRGALSATLQSVSDVVISVSDTGAVCEMNDAAEALGGWVFEEVRGRPCQELLAFIDAKTRKSLDNPLLTALDSGTRTRLPQGAMLRTATGSELAVEGGATPITDGAGGPSGAVLALRDVSQERRHARQAELNERLAALGTLAASVTRELETPLSFVIGNQQHAARELSALRELLDGLEPRRQKLALELSLEIGAALRDANSGAERLRATVSKLETLARPRVASPGSDVDANRAFASGRNTVSACATPLHVEAPAGAGIFRVALPEPAKIAGPRAAVAPRAVRARPDLCARLLVVDDEPILLDALTRSLDGHYATDRATGAQAALELLALGNEYDLILCDLMMPNMTGMDLFRELEQRFPATAHRIAFMTGGAFTLSAQEFVSTPGRRVLEKPFTNDELFTFVSACLNAVPPKQADVS